MNELKVLWNAIPTAGRWALAVVALIVVANLGGETSSDGQAADDASAAKTVAPERITAESLKRDGTFWVKQDAASKEQLVDLCRSAAKRQAADDYADRKDVRLIGKVPAKRAIAKIDEAYEYDFDREDKISETCVDELPDAARDYGYELEDRKMERQIARDEARYEREEQAARDRRRQLKDFRATNKMVGVLIKEKLGAENVDGKKRLRSVSCTDRSACTIGYTEDPSGSLIGEFMGTNTAEKAERHFFSTMADLYKVLFRDPQLGQATLVAYGTVISPGGKESTKPVMRMTCTRSAHKQIDWDSIAYSRPDGFKQLCSYEPLVSLG
jgi:hypothetical protein